MIFPGYGSSAGEKTLHVVYPHESSPSTLTGYSITSSLSSNTYTIEITIPDWNSDREFVGIYLPVALKDSSNHYVSLAITKSDGTYNGYSFWAGNGMVAFTFANKISYSQSGSNFVITITQTVTSNQLGYTATTTPMVVDHYVYLE